MSYRRVDRINELLKQEISLLLRGELADPRVAGATITAVKASPELDSARVFVTALGDDEEKEEAVAGLISAAPFIRRTLSRKLTLRRVPELRFEVDHQLEGAQRIERLLREVSPPPEEDGEKE